MDDRTIAVTAGVIRRNGTILLTRRPPGGRQAGLWEFPGGKIEPGEEAEACLARELHEELGILVRVGQFLHATTHAYAHARIRLLFFEVEYDGSELTLHEHDASAWVAPADLLSYPLAPADIPFARWLQQRKG